MRVITKVLIEHGDAVWLALDRVKADGVAEHMGVNIVKVSHWKRGRIMVPWEQYVRLCKYLGVKVSDE